MSCPYELDDAAYLLGALPPGQRLAYEAHLTGCPACAAAVRDLSGLPGLLARVPEPEAPPGEDLPDLLPGLLARIATERRGRRRANTVLAAAAASVALLAGLLMGGVFRPEPTPAGSPVALRPVAAAAGAGIEVQARLADRAWGTSIELRCSYPGASGGSGSVPPTGAAGANRYAVGGYVLVATNRLGQTQQVAAWSAVPGRVSTVAAASSWHPADLAALDVRTAAGSPVLRWTR